MMCTKDTRRENVQFWEKKKGQGYMKAFLILEDGTVFQGTSIGSAVCLFYFSISPAFFVKKSEISLLDVKKSKDYRIFNRYRNRDRFREDSFFYV